MWKQWGEWSSQVKVWRKTVLGYGTAGVKAFQPTLRSGALGCLGNTKTSTGRAEMWRSGLGSGQARQGITDTVSMVMLLVDFRWGVVSVFKIGLCGVGWASCLPHTERSQVWLLVKATYLGCGFAPLLGGGAWGRQPVSMSPSHRYFPLSFPLFLSSSFPSYLSPILSESMAKILG